MGSGGWWGGFSVFSNRMGTPDYFLKYMFKVCDFVHIFGSFVLILLLPKLESFRILLTSLTEYMYHNVVSKK